MILKFKNVELYRKWAYFQDETATKIIEEIANDIELGYTEFEITSPEPNEYVLKSPIPQSINS